jgi:hypothetical protein
MAAEPRPPLLDRKKLVGLTEETTSGTAATVTAAIAVNHYNVQHNCDDFFADGKRKPQGNYVGSVTSITGKTSGKCSYDMEVLGGGPFLAYLTGCGYKINVATYAPSSSMADRKTWTVVVWEEGRRKQLNGAVCNVKLKGKNGAKLIASFEWSGVWVAPIDEAMPSRAPILTVPYKCKGMTATIAGAAFANISEFEIDLGATVEERQSVTAASGIHHFLVTDIDPMVTMDPEARLIADMDSYGLMLAGTSFALVLAVTNGSTTLTITAGAAQRQNITTGARDLKATDALQVLCSVSSGNDALTLVEA